MRSQDEFILSMNNLSVIIVKKKKNNNNNTVSLNLRLLITFDNVTPNYVMSFEFCGAFISLIRIEPET